MTDLQKVIADAEISGAVARGEFPGSGMLAGQGGRLDLGIGLTAAELEVLDHLSAASRAFFALPDPHPTDAHEWAHEVHHLQMRVMCRAAVRSDPERFR